MQLYQLEQFCAIARHEHISRAADELYVSQPALSINLARLEKELGVTLFDRVGRNIKLNPCGKEFYSHAERALKELELAKEIISEIKSDRATPVAFGDALFNETSDMMSAYLDINPARSIAHIVLTVPEIIWKLECGELDFAIAVFPKNHDFAKKLKWETLWRVRLMVIAHHTHRLAGRGSVKLSELSGERFLNAIKGFNTRDAFDYYCNLAGFDPIYRYEDTKPYIFNDITRHDGSLSVICENMWEQRRVARPTPSGKTPDVEELVGLKIKEPSCGVEFGILTLKDNPLSNSAKDFIAFVKEYFNKNDGIF